jgi:DNA-binding transcriptional LysR family regulator
VPWNDRTKRRLKLRDLDVLTVVVETGSMGKAASRLGISQPGVSKAVADLESAVGVRLLDRSRRGVLPTPYALALCKRSIAIFNDLRQGVQEIDFLADPSKGEIRMGATEPIITGILSHVMNRMSRKHRELVFHVVASDTAGLYRSVIERNIEFAVCRIIGRLPDELEAEVLFHDSFAIMTSARNPLTRRRKLTLADLSNEPWTLFPFDSFFGSVIEETFRANGQEPPRLTVTSLSLYVQNEMLATHRFITVLPSFVLKFPGRHPPLKALPIALPNAPMPIGIITLKNRTLTPAAKVFLQNVRALANSPANAARRER